eukprot:6183382-Pleurochrysis_carterae.AAC.2
MPSEGYGADASPSSPVAQGATPRLPRLLCRAPTAARTFALTVRSAYRLCVPGGVPCDAWPWLLCCSARRGRALRLACHAAR